MAGVAFALDQAYLYAQLGVWSQWRAVNLFAEPRIPIDEGQVKKDIKKLVSDQPALPDSIRVWIVYKQLNSIVPSRFRSEASRLTDSRRPHGPRKISIRWLNRPLSLLLVLAGSVIFILSRLLPPEEPASDAL